MDDRQPSASPLVAGALPATVVVPVKNEQANLPSCLSALDGFAQILVVDSSSIDATPMIVRQFGAAYLNFEWNGRYPKKRNWVLQTYAFKTPWVLFIDADEDVTDAFKAELQTRLQDDAVHGYWLTYQNYFRGRLMRHGIPFRKLALFRVGSGFYEQVDEDHWTALDMEIHEHPIVDGPVSEIRAPIDHRDRDDSHDFKARHEAYATWEAHRFRTLLGKEAGHLTDRQRLKYRYLGRPWFGLAYFIMQYVVRLGFLDGLIGFSYALHKSRYFYSIYRKIRAGEKGVDSRFEEPANDRF